MEADEEVREKIRLRHNAKAFLYEKN